MKRQITIGIVAPSSVVPKVELGLGIKRLLSEGFQVKAHTQCKKAHLFFAGRDEERAAAFLEFAYNDDIDVIWCARGGHGSLRLLSLFDQTAARKGAPRRKLLVGYSDSTALMEYVRKNWGWSILHAPMPSLRKFSILPEHEWEPMIQWIQKETPLHPWGKQKLKFWTRPPLTPLEGELVGGNLTVWNCLSGTEYEPSSCGKLLFLEEIDEPLYKIDRMLCQLSLSKGFPGVKGVLLGGFLNCKDYAPSVLKSVPVRKKTIENPKASELKPLRKIYPELAGLKAIFQDWGDRAKIPVAFGLPVGHGPEFSSLPLGARYRLSPNGKWELLTWDWTSDAT